MQNNLPQLPVVMKSGDDIGSSTLAAAVFVKMFAYYICAECGFVGGIFFPMMLMSTMLGRVFVNVTSVKQGPALACSLVALPAALVPSPFFLTVLAVVLFFYVPQVGMSTLSCVIVSYTLFVGVGIPQTLASMSEKRKKAKLKPTHDGNVA